MRTALTDEDELPTTFRGGLWSHGPAVDPPWIASTLGAILVAFAAWLVGLPVALVEGVKGIRRARCSVNGGAVLGIVLAIIVLALAVRALIQ